MTPFPGGIDALANGTLLLSALAALLYLVLRSRPAAWRRTVVKTAAVGLLALLAGIEGGPQLLVAALVLSAAGDALLAQEGDRPFLAGLVAFFLAHLVFVLLFVTEGGGIAGMMSHWARPVIVLAAFAGAGLLLARLLPGVQPPWRRAVPPYVLAILAMLAAAATVPAPLVVAGALLFAISDGLLAIERFRLAREGIPTGHIAWVLYYLAQAAITLGLLL